MIMLRKGQKERKKWMSRCLNAAAVHERSGVIRESSPSPLCRSSLKRTGTWSCTMGWHLRPHGQHSTLWP